MIVPNKFIRFDDSILRRIDGVLSEIDDEITVHDLYKKTDRKVGGIENFILALDVLFALGRIDVDYSRGVVTCASQD